jgi:hypothetical protein
LAELVEAASFSFIGPEEEVAFDKLRQAGLGRPLVGLEAA